ncbi:MAG: hypothetical protein ACK4NF_03880 [Planctomycetota bacterium]
MEYLYFTIYSLIIVLGAFLVSWGAESAQILVSQGLVLAVLAWVQILPEFSVEATLSYSAAKNPKELDFVAANFTGSIRLLVGVGIPLIFLTRAIFLHSLRKALSYKIILPRLHGISVVGNFVPIIIFLLVIVKKSLSLLDSIILIIIYGVYLWVLKKTPPAGEEQTEEMDFIPRKISGLSSFLRWFIIATLFAGGGTIFYFFVHPFVESCKVIAVKLGLSAFIFIQWVAPFLTEFPEKLTVFYWAKNEKKAPIGLLNILNANISQWTLLPAMIPIVYFIGSGNVNIRWDEKHILEIALTMAQTVFLTSLLMDKNLNFWDAILIFILWFIQFLSPLFGSRYIEDSVREIMIFLYLALSLLKITISILKKQDSHIYSDFIELLKR